MPLDSRAHLIKLVGRQYTTTVIIGKFAIAYINFQPWVRLAVTNANTETRFLEINQSASQNAGADDSVMPLSLMRTRGSDLLLSDMPFKLGAILVMHSDLR